MECPHCHIGIEIAEVNCGIFRCGIYKDTYLQIPPHLPEPECIALRDRIFGCSRPFRILHGKLEKCDYI
jgi:hypothetical protein